jgi:hypothetical protein
MFRSTIRACAAALFLAATATIATAQQAYEAESKAWKFVAPFDWNQIHFRIMQQEDEFSRARYPQKNYKYIAGFTKGQMNTFTLPYILVNKTEVDLSGVKWEDIEQGFAQTNPRSARDKALAGFVAQWQMGDTVVDREHCRTVSLAQYQNQRGEAIKCTTYSYLGAKYIIQLECYDLASTNDKNLPAIDALVNSFAFKDDAKFYPTQDAGRFANANFRRSSSNRPYYYGGATGGLIAVGVVLRVALKAWARD